MADDTGKNWWERNVEDRLSEVVDEQRAHLPEDQRLQHDIGVGTVKGLYGGGKSLVTGLIDLAGFAAKVYKGDPATLEKVWDVTKKVATEGWIAQFGSPEEKADQARRAAEAAKQIGTAVKDKLGKEWDQAEKEGKKAELISEWTSRGIVEVGALFIGAGELKAAARAGELGELSKVGEVGSIITKCPAKAVELDRTFEAARLLERAAEAEQKVTPKLQALAKQEGMTMEGLQHKFKGQDSLIRKLTDVPADKIGDSLRYTLVAGPDELGQAAQRTLTALQEEGYEILKVKNTFTPGTPYKGINTQIRSPDGQLFELQFHTAESFRTKEDAHSIYEVVRTLKVNDPKEAELTAEMVRRAESVAIPKGLNEALKDFIK